MKNSITIKIILLGTLFWCSAAQHASAAPRGQRLIFGAARGLTFYTSPDLATINSRLGNSPRLNVEHEFGRAFTNQATFEYTALRDIWTWGAEAQQWAETHRGSATSGEGSPRSEATLAFVRLWVTGGVRLWPWVGPIVVKQNTNLLGRAVRMARTRALESGLFSWLRLGTGPLLWKHDYLLSDEPNQTQIDYASRTLSWEGGLRWTLGWRLGSFCDVGLDVSASRSLALKSENIVGQYYLSGRESLDTASELKVNDLSKSKWQATQTLVFVRFFYP